jgi:hypothetical protein
VLISDPHNINRTKSKQQNRPVATMRSSATPPSAFTPQF